MTNFPLPDDDLPAPPTALDELLHSTLQERIDELSVSMPGDAVPQCCTQMDAPKLTPKFRSAQLSEHLTYTQFDTCTALLINAQDRQMVVLCVAAGDVVPTHPSLQATAISVMNGEGIMEIEGEQTELAADVTVYIPPRALHSIRAIADLSLLCAWAD